MSILFDAACNKAEEEYKKRIDEQAQRIVLEEYLDKSKHVISNLRDENQNLKIKVSKYEPVFSSLESDSVKNFKNKFTKSVDWLRNLEKEEEERNKKRYRELFASKYSFLN
jgi:predicted RNase H-like nuclease (RuvC/YqgF family)